MSRYEVCRKCSNPIIRKPTMHCGIAAQVVAMSHLEVSTGWGLNWPSLSQEPFPSVWLRQQGWVWQGGRAPARAARLWSPSLNSSAS